VEKENKFVRSTQWQSTLLFIGIILVDVVLKMIPYSAFSS